MSRESVIGIDIGGTSVTADLVNCNGELIASLSRRTGQGEEALEAIAALVADAAEVAASWDVRLRGIGVLTPGHVEERTGVVHFASNLGWIEVPLATTLRRNPRIADVPLAVGHDVRWAGIAEGAFGAARGIRDYAVLSIGTGIAACLVVDGAVLSGASGSAGEIGHATAVPGGDFCACGRVGCLDAYASGAGLLRRYGALSGRTDLRSVADLLGLLAKDPHARTVWGEAIDALAVGLCTTIMTVDPALVSLVGGVSQAGGLLTGPLTERLTAELGWKSVPPLVVSPLRAIPGRAGAVMLGMRAGGDDRCVAAWSTEDVAAWQGARALDGAR
ncbi:ROK family protein [Brachybacterium paraconglomeratum]|uniref:ROK family protein n=1 Tax=Brachybacterium paraconglomeratum TaxID=173362 RepID=UPI003FD4F164